VKKGSKAIKILAPYIKRIIETDPKTGGEKEKEITYFWVVSVFDESQTEGQPLPEVDITINGDNYIDFFQMLLEFCKTRNIKVDLRNLGINGYMATARAVRLPCATQKASTRRQTRLSTNWRMRFCSIKTRRLIVSNVNTGRERCLCCNQTFQHGE